jgi:signal transduction histidine kinase
MSHEIRTPLNVILGYGELLGERVREVGGPSDIEMVEAVERSSRRLLDTVSGVLDLARLETGDFSVRPTLVELGSLAREVLADYRREGERKGLALSVREEERVSVRADRYCLRNALARLVDNAIKFTPEGRVELRLWRDPSGDVCLDVVDTGIGIDDSYRPHLFEPFSQASTGSTRRFEGAGLGLALARRYLERTGASLEVWSRSGAGSIFRIRLPRTSETPIDPGGS